MSISKATALVRSCIIMEAIDVVNAANQLHLIKDEKAEELNCRYTMTLFDDVFPRIYGQEAVDKALGK